MQRVLGGLVASVILFAASSASALEIYGIDMKIGLRGGPNMPLMNEPPERSRLYASTPYTNYTGLGWNVGGALSVRAFDIASLEIGILYSQERVSGTVELDDVQEQIGTRAFNQEIEQTFSVSQVHIPIVAQASLPTGVARPFISLGVDLVTSRGSREYDYNGIDPLPDELDPTIESEAATLEQWENSALAQNVFRGELNSDTASTYAGFIAGVGVNIALKRVELPVEFRLHLYPESGGTMGDRGNFEQCAPEVDPSCLDFDPAAPAPQYNDVWTTQFLVLFGIDYRIF